MAIAQSAIRAMAPEVAIPPVQLGREPEIHAVHTAMNVSGMKRVAMTVRTFI